MFFVNEQCENVCEENFGISFGQVGKFFGECWKVFDDKQCVFYEVKVVVDKKCYEDEKVVYNVS